MKLVFIKASRGSDSDTICELIGKAYIDYNHNASILIYKNNTNIKIDPMEFANEITLDQLLTESIDSDGYVDVLDVNLPDAVGNERIRDDQKQAFMTSVKKLFKTYSLVMINSPTFDINFKDIPTLIIFEPTKGALDEVGDFEFEDEAHLILNQASDKDISKEMRDLIADMDLKLVAKFKNKHDEDENGQIYDDERPNLEKVLRALQLVE